MLTTDAKPDPPRIPVEGYTHNLESNTVNDNGPKTTKFESVFITSGAQLQQNVTSSEKNDAVPITNAKSSAKEEDLNDTKASSQNANERKIPNVKTKTKSKHKYCMYCSFIYLLKEIKFAHTEVIVFLFYSTRNACSEL